MPTGSEIQWWLVAVQGHAGNQVLLYFKHSVFFGLPSGSEIQWWLVAAQCHSGNQIQIFFQTFFFGGVGGHGDLKFHSDCTDRTNPPNCDSYAHNAITAETDTCQSEEFTRAPKGLSPTGDVPDRIQLVSARSQLEGTVHIGWPRKRKMCL